MKITPGHDHTDYEVGKRHNLEFLTLFDDNGLVSKVGGQFEVSNSFHEICLVFLLKLL